MTLLSPIFKKIGMIKLPLSWYPNRFTDIPAIPVLIGDVGETFDQSESRKTEHKQANFGLSKSYSINGETGTGYYFMYPKEEEDSFSLSLKKKILAQFLDLIAIRGLINVFFNKEKSAIVSLPSPTCLSLDDPEQWTMGWTSFGKVYDAGEPNRSTWVSALTDADKATEQFWPTIAEHGLVYNLLILQKVGKAQVSALKRLFDSVWTSDSELDKLYNQGNLYAIDMSIFKMVEPKAPSKKQDIKMPKSNSLCEEEGIERFTPSTITLLKRDEESKKITPIAIHVAGYQNANAQIYTRENATDSAWLYALQAAKVSVTVYGIWLGHVYHWHIVTGAMQMTMYKTFSKDHAIYQLLAPQSKYLVGFDTVLLALWGEVAPPTSIDTGHQFLKLCDIFAKERHFFDDDPHVTLSKLALDEADFTQDEPWDLYPIVGHYLRIWKITADYVDTFVEVAYSDDQAVADDKELQKWIKASKKKGNIKGLPPMNSQENLKKVLTSLIYRVTMHGVSRLNSESMPVLTFVANYPSCLQRKDIPRPDKELAPNLGHEFQTKELLKYLPKTGTIGKMLEFYFIFIFSAPYEPFIPLTGVEKDLFFDKKYHECNKALIQYRNDLICFIKKYQNDEHPLICQWPLSVET